ncbi:MAG: hypothetical protein K0S58_3262 [Nitrospira sp.]|jgi:hypothetical protein|nr:hypothetical protein [Nitrospira sp.]
MHTPQLDQTADPTASSPVCRHKRLVDRVLSDNGMETGKVRCLECGAIIADHVASTPR